MNVGDVVRLVRRVRAREAAPARVRLTQDAGSEYYVARFYPEDQTVAVVDHCGTWFVFRQRDLVFVRRCHLIG